ncbi:extracellular solute-binding protein [Paenibacillus sacheonensis]|uniref:Extracellular solute-binding protein n=1 Tax=Paenibacillus sacheonensis TaxID=742054 RepID=A0A7X4YJB4_9BACL|nr:extracellular solute-binding protein [Paenibacillus sacheonensis]MBM7564241.1 ABC-type glycerol-3-phosphate transport system substrate-binding protein [Paenibacillus sacheonensis]NBC67436.1 extracellular solute-binding protein [Paenibacillus sacheonensis]
MSVRKSYVYAAIIALIVLFYVYRSFGGDEGAFPVVSADSIKLAGFDDGEGSPFYHEALESYAAGGIRDYQGKPVNVNPADYSGSGDNAKLAVASDSKGNGNSLSWNNSEGWTEWTVDVPADGLYTIELRYEPLQANSTSSVFYGLRIDGKYPFAEAKSIELIKYWQDRTRPFAKDELGNEIRSAQVAVSGWETEQLRNYAVSSEPLRFSLKKGIHKLRFLALNEAMKWGAIRLTAPEQLPAYDKDADGAHAANADSAWYKVIEAESYDRKSHPSLQVGSYSEPHVSPDPKGRVVYNTIDGSRWQKAGQWAEWSVDVPENGWYELDVKYYQRFQGKSNIYRTIQIDGRTPYEEMLHYAFPYNSKLTVYPIQDKDGVPYRFYMEKGKHEIRLVADASLLDPAILSLRSAISEMFGLEQMIRKVTGDYGANAGDANRTWDLAAYIPDLETRLSGVRDRLHTVETYLNGLNQNTNDATNSINVGIAVLDDLLSDLDDIPQKMGKLTDLQTRLGTWLDTFSQQGMTMDYLVVKSPGAKPELKESNWASKIPYTAVNFLRTFKLKYDTRSDKDDKTLQIWVARGRDYADLLQEMTNQSFTPQTGIKVNINLMPDPNALLLSNAGDDQPDAALGVPMDMPTDYAMRRAAADLSKLPGFADAVSQFNPGAMRSFAFNQGVYALPETQSYYLMFYRKSVMKELGLGVPQTWDDVRKLLPTLQENAMSFYYPSKDYAPFFLQNGVSLYSQDGLKPGFDTEAAYRAFTMWTDLYGKFELPRDVPSFFNHFKRGDMPIGVADFNTYIQLLVSAPEIRDDWGVAAMPGILRPDGKIARWAPNNMTSAMILGKSDKKDQAWTFLKWWTSKEVQLEYGSNIESFNGPEYRWNTANMPALAEMPWPSADISAIEEQNRWTLNIPAVPGGYYLGREMDFAWNRTVVQKVPPKASLDRAFTDLEREMLRKQNNLNLDGKYDLRLPVIDKPFEWRTVQP